MQKDVYLCFVDFQKAFNTVKHEQLIEMLGEVGVDSKDFRLITNFYSEQQATVQVGDSRTD